jgi:hypothetical protein
MKKFLFVLLALAFTLPVGAAQVCVDTVCLTTTADENQAETFFRDMHNKSLCEGVGLPATCTQAEFDAVIPTPPPATIYTNDADGVRAYFLDRIKEHLQARVDYYDNSFDQRARDAWRDGSLAQRQAACQALGKAIDCTEL